MRRITMFLFLTTAFIACGEQGSGISQNGKREDGTRAAPPTGGEHVQVQPAPSSGGGSASSSTRSLSAAPWKHDDIIMQAESYLLASQKPDGSWGEYATGRPYEVTLGELNSLHAFGNASSALVCMALLGQSPGAAVDAALRKGYVWLVNAPDATRVTGGVMYNVWGQLYVIQGLALGLADERLRDLREAMRGRLLFELGRLERMQTAVGGWAYYDFRHAVAPPSGGHVAAFTTAAALVALKEAERAGIRVSPAMATGAINTLRRLRLPNGAYGYGGTRIGFARSASAKLQGSIGRNQACNNALATWDAGVSGEMVLAGLEDFFRLRHFLENGRQRQWPHEAYYATAGYYYYFGHYYASRNLDFLSGEPRKFYADSLADVIAATQGADGSFWDFPIYGYSRAYGTGFALMTLQRCRAATRQE